MRTTVDIDEPVLKEVKRLQKRDGRPLGRIVSDLLAEAVGRRRDHEPAAPGFSWTSRPMDARVDLADKDAVRAALDASEPSDRSRRRAS